jgi:SAM-dependent methyltransferase
MDDDRRRIEPAGKQLLTHRLRRRADTLRPNGSEVRVGLGLRRRLEEAAATYPVLRRALTMAYMVRTDYLSRGARHPLDRRYGVRTQSHVPLYLSMTGSPADRQMVPYGGCVASVLRHVLDRLAPTGNFVDIGCGKGRALIIAAEYPFARIVGIELNAEIAAVARANARRMARRHPERTAIDVRVGDASIPDLPDGDTIVFLYHPFGEPLVRRLRDHLAAAARPGRSFTVIYENPVHGAVFDAHPDFVRHYAAMLPCEDNERAFAFDAEEAVIVWQIGATSAAAAAGADRRLRTVKEGFRVVLAP